MSGNRPEIALIEQVAKDMRLAATFLSATLLLFLSGCASNIPELIRTAPAGDLHVDEVQQQKAMEFSGSVVRWGGSIISVHNEAQVTRIEVLARKLNKKGKPLEEGKSSGRFIAQIPGFLEPEEYPKDRFITVTGELKEVIKQAVGSYPYPYPVVEVKAYHLWPEVKYYSPPYYYDPFYDPYFYPYPYWRRYPYWY
jgi:outer membrane lipoprotein